MPSRLEYKYGCRCDGCRSFNAARMRAHRAGVRTGRLPRQPGLPSLLVRLRREIGIVADATTTMRRV